MNDSSASSLIAAHGGRVTRTRVVVLELLRASARPLSHDEIADALRGQGTGVDRVTLYRTLDWLVEQGIAHRLAGPDRSWRFSVAATPAHAHAHFQCDRCGQIYCLEDVQPALALTLPPGYEMQRAELVLHGNCPRCGAHTVHNKTK